jgi:hypothetical protein
MSWSVLDGTVIGEFAKASGVQDCLAPADILVQILAIKQLLGVDVGQVSRSIF